MKRYVKLFAVIGLVLILSLTIVGMASADVVKGKGWLSARGSGLAHLYMTGRVDIVGHGVGTVYVRGAEEIEASGHGRRLNRADGVVVFYGYEGEIHLAGERMVVKMAGKEIEFTAAGKGTAWLRGYGSYETGHGASGDWAPNGLTVEVVDE
ncbi:MAG: hypothetical protein AB1801_11425 [Chloroflexota bacterium]